MANFSFAIWIALAGGLLLLLLYAAVANARRRRSPEVALEEVIPFLLPVKVEALAEIMNAKSDAYHRHTCSREELRRMELHRFRLALEYLRRMAHNAALLQRIGYGQLHSGNELVAAQAQELIDAGVHVRLYSLMAKFALYLGRVISLTRISELRGLMSSNLLPAYALLREKAESLTAFRDTAFHDALLQSL